MYEMESLIETDFSNIQTRMNANQKKTQSFT